MKIQSSAALVATLLSFALLITAPAVADNHEDDLDDLDAIEQVERQPEPRTKDEIVVQGRRREELLQSTPLSIRAFDATELEERAITRVDEIGFATANLQFDTTTGSNTNARIYIRGVGQDDARSLVDPGVGVYIDDVYLPRLSGGLFRLVDIQQIEVLRGPQGTLFGKNTVGGVISVHTARPSPDFGTRGSFRVGNLGLFETSLSADIPIKFGPFKDKVFTRFSFASATDDGWLTNLAETQTGAVVADGAGGFTPVQSGRAGHGGDDKFLGGRFALFAQPTDDLEIDFTFDFSREGNERQRFSQCQQTNPFNLGRLVVDNFTRFQSECDSTAALARDYKGYASPIRKSTPDVFGIMLRPTYHINDDWSVKSITSWRRRDTEQTAVDLDQTPTQFLGSGDDTDLHDAVSQEFQFSGTLLDGDLNLTTGVYFFWEQGETITNGQILQAFTPRNPIPCAAADLNGDGVSDALDTISDPNCTLASLDPFLDAFLALGFPSDGTGARTPSPIPLSLFDPIVGNALCVTDPSDPTECVSLTPTDPASFAAIGPFPFQRGVANLNNRAEANFENQSYAGYGQGSYHITDDLELTLGVRYTLERKRRTGRQPPAFPCGYVPEPGQVAALGIERDGCPLLAATRNELDPDANGVPNIDLNNDGTIDDDDFRAAIFVRPVQEGVDQDRTAGSFTPLIQLGWQATEDVYTYGQWSQGFKSGGFDESILTEQELIDRTAGGSARFLEFNDERSNAFEVGVKTQWWDKQLTANLTGYVNLYDDIQLTVVGLNSSGILAFRIVNAGEATIAGFEAELGANIQETWIPGKNARIVLGAGIGYTNASFTSFTTNEVAPQVVTPNCGTGYNGNRGNPTLCTPTADPNVFVPVPIPIQDLCTSLKFSDCLPGGVAQPATASGVNSFNDDGGLPFFFEAPRADGTINTQAPLAIGGAFSLTQVLGALITPQVEEVERKNLDFKNTPEWDMTFSGAYFTDIFDLGTMSLRMDYSFQSSVFYNTDNTVGEEAFGLLNGRLSFQTDRFFGVDLTTAVYARNIFDFRYLDSGVDLGVGIGLNALSFAPPRRFGFEMIARY